MSKDWLHDLIVASVFEVKVCKVVKANPGISSTGLAAILWPADNPVQEKKKRGITKLHLNRLVQRNLIHCLYVPSFGRYGYFTTPDGLRVGSMYMPELNDYDNTIEKVGV